VSIEASQYRERQLRLADACRAEGLCGAIVISRGGGTLDRYANVYYLTGHYQPFAYLPDTPRLFSGRSHTAVLVNSEGQSLLCLSTPAEEIAAQVSCETRYGPSFPATIIAACGELDMAAGPIGLVGADVMPYSLGRELAGKLPVAEATSLDDELERHRRIKSPQELALVRSAAATGRQAVDALLQQLTPGITEAEAVAAAVATAVSQGAALYFAAVSAGAAPRSYTGQPLPGFGRRSLRAGDLVRFDLGVVRDGYLCDFGRTVVVGAEPSAGQQSLLTTLHGALDVTISAIRPGALVRDVVKAGDRALAEAGVTVGDQPEAGALSGSYPAHWGHGLGLGWERPWLFDGEDMEVEAGMVLAVERAITHRQAGTAAAEQNLIVTESGTELLTGGHDGRWS
jgi:Xaa-Pro dipeptidase